MVTAYFYIMYAVRRFTRAGPRNRFGEFQALIALVIAEGSPIISAIPPRFFSGWFALVIALVLAFLNAWIFSEGNVAWRTQCEQFAKMRRGHRVAADIGVALFFLVTIVLAPILGRWATLGHL